MAESAQHSEELEAKKRRSTRIVQAVPLTVTGVDALGRPFQERTSTLFINCHGCRYQSKHYVLKNMWVTLEVPHPESGREPRVVRARVTWIQRPRTVRELFQIGVELEVAGNVWGIAFPPEDWFPFPEGGRAIPVAAAEPQPEPQQEEWVLPAVPAAREDNVRVLPGPAGTEASVSLARQVARLVVEAKQQVQSAVREATSSAVAAETRPLLAALQLQMKAAAEKSVQDAVAAHAEEVLRQTLAKIDEARERGVEALREKWNRELQRQIEEVTPRWTGQLANISRGHQLAFEQHLQNHLNLTLAKLNDLGAEITASPEAARANVEHFCKEMEESAESASRRWKEMVEGRAEEAKTRLEELAQTARHLKDEIAAGITAAQAGWRGRLDADLAAATTRWNEKVETSLDAAAKHAAERLARNSQAATAKLEQELTLRVGALRQSFDQAAAESENVLSTITQGLNKEAARARASLAEMQQTATRIEDFSGRLDAMSEATAEKLHQRFEEILAAESAELNRRAESSVASMAERLQPVLETAGQQTITRLASQLEQQLTPQIDRANELFQKLTSGQSQAEQLLQAHEQRVRDLSEQLKQKLTSGQVEAEQALHAHEQRMHEASERSTQEALAALQGSVSQFEQHFEEAGRAATAKWLAELELKATDTTHTAFEALHKSSEWYEKKVQTHMQSTIDKGLEQASNSLREKAGEISGLFASELDHYSRSYVEHSQTQMDEAVKEAVERTRGHFRQLSENAAASFSDQARRTAERELERFTGSLTVAVEKNQGRLDSYADQVRAKMDASSRQFFAEFEKGMAQQMQQGVTKAEQEFDAYAAPVKDSWRAECKEQERTLQESFGRLSNESIDAYKRRLENASNSWLVTTVTKLSQQAQDVIGTLAATAEQRLHDTCSQVFANVGETLRQRLLELSKNLATQNSPKDKK